jgi:hypothetical protein
LLYFVIQKDGFEVEFEAVKDENDKLKAENVTSADGTACPGPEPRERRNRNRKKGGADDDGDEAAAENGGEAGGEGADGGAEQNDKEGGNRGGKKNRRRRKNGKKAEDGTAEGATPAAPKPKPPPKPTWYSELDEGVKQLMETNGIKVDGGRAFVAVGDARVKIGTTGYTALAHATGIIAEGTYTCENDGIVKPTWTKVLKFDGEDGEWKPSDATEQEDVLVGDINLSDGAYSFVAQCHLNHWISFVFSFFVL